MNGTITLARPTLATIAAAMTIGGIVIGFVSNHLLFYSGIASRLTALETAQVYVGKELTELGAAQNYVGKELARLTLSVAPK